MAASPASMLGVGQSGVCPRADDDLVLPAVVDCDDRRSRRRGADDPHVAGVDAGLGQDLEDPPSMDVVADRAGEFTEAPARAAATAWLPPLPPGLNVASDPGRFRPPEAGSGRGCSGRY